MKKPEIFPKRKTQNNFDEFESRVVLITNLVDEINKDFPDYPILFLAASKATNDGPGKGKGQMINPQELGNLMKNVMEQSEEFAAIVEEPS